MISSLGLFCDREDWILGTTSSEIAKLLENGKTTNIILSSERRLVSNPVMEIRRLRQCECIHWLSPHAFLDYGGMFPGSKAICTIHHCLPGDRNEPSGFLRTLILTVSELSKRELHRREFNNVRVVNNGVDVSLFRAVSTEEARRRLGIPSTTMCLVGFFGKSSSNPEDRKGTKVLLDLIQRCAKANTFALLFSGSGWEELARRVDELGVPVFHRKVDTLAEMPLLYSAVDVYLCTSRIEGGPVTVLEAMASERAVLASRVGHVPEVISNFRDGIVCEHDDVEGFARNLCLLLRKSSLREQLGRKARETVVENWTWERRLTPLIDIYSEAKTLPKRVLTPSNYVHSMVRLLWRAARHSRFADI